MLIRSIENFSLPRLFPFSALVLRGNARPAPAWPGFARKKPLALLPIMVSRAKTMPARGFLRPAEAPKPRGLFNTREISDNFY